MRFLDLLQLILENLNRRKGRVLLTAVGVTIGTAAVVILVSLGVGLQKNFTSQLGGIGSLTQISVYPNYGEGGPGMVVYAKGGGGGGGGGGGISQIQLITPQSLKDFTGIPGVTEVIPRDYSQVGMMMKYGMLESYANVIGIGTNDLSLLDLKLQSGTLILEPGTAIIGAPVVNQFYNPKLRPGQDPPLPPDLLDQSVRLVLSKYTNDGLEIKKTINVRIVGIIKESRSESDYSMYMPLADLNTINEWGMGRRINRTKDGYQMAMVNVKDVKSVLDISNQIKELGYQANTPQEFVQGINSFFIILQFVFGGVGAVALLVAAIGIANTMAMAILERTKEIGLMKAVGATNRDVLSIFLGEAAGIGFIGGLGGTLLGWGGSLILNILMMGYLTSQAASNGGTMPTGASSTPIWLPLFSLAFATLVGLLSGLYPALRAATLLPVTALKYE
jgi:putative ABC transport system permease protein